MKYLLLLLLQDNLPPKQDDVDKAIEKGAKWLLDYVGGGLPADTQINYGMGLNYDGLVLYTLCHAGVGKDNATFKALADRVGKMKITRTYIASCNAMGLRAFDPARYKGKIWECGQFLIDNQCENGQWSYGEAYDIPKMPNFDDSGTKSRTRITRSTKAPVLQKAGDNSNSQYAALGLFASWMAGFDPEKSTVDRGLDWWERSQLGDGSWHYAEKGDLKWRESEGFGSMTAGGGSSVIMLRRIRGDTVKPSVARKAIDWCAAKFTVTENPGGPEDRKRFHYYWLYALERLGDLYPTEKMGKHAWYAQGANYLLREQQTGGFWRGPERGMEIADTCFAILFLERATKVATGGSKR